MQVHNALHFVIGSTYVKLNSRFVYRVVNSEKRVAIFWSNSYKTWFLVAKINNTLYVNVFAKRDKYFLNNIKYWKHD